MNKSKSSESDVQSWIEWFCSLRGNEFFCEVPIDYIEDNFNIYGTCYDSVTAEPVQSRANVFCFEI